MSEYEATEQVGEQQADEVGGGPAPEVRPAEATAAPGPPVETPADPTAVDVPADASAAPTPEVDAEAAPGTPATLTPATLTPVTLTPATVTPTAATPAPLTPATVTPATEAPTTEAPALLTPALLTPATVNPSDADPVEGAADPSGPERPSSPEEPSGPEEPSAAVSPATVTAPSAPATSTPAITTPATPAPPPARPTPAPPRPAPPRLARPVVPAPPPAAARPAANAPAAAVAQPSPVTAASGDPSRWGRVDAEGVIYVRTADGERTVGSWQAGAPEEGLAHFARRFDDMLTEVELLFARLLAGGGEPKQALSTAKTLRDGLPEATVVGDLAGLGARLDDLVAHAEKSVAEARSARDAQRTAAVARKEELAGEAEALATEATQWKQAGDRFTVILDEWRTIRGIDRKTDELLWKRFSKAREAFNRRRGSHFADLDRQRSTAKGRKEELAVEAEKLSDSEDWGPTAARFRDLMTEWKAAGRAHKDADDVLWQRFRAAQDAFFARRSATFDERDTEFATNAEAKKALLVEAEKIDLSDPSGARAALRGLQERWEEIGKVPRDDVRPLDTRLRAIEDKVREAADRQWQRTDPEAEARVAQFRERVAQFEAQAEKARAAGKTKRAEEADAQAAQWREWAVTAEQAVQHR